MLNKIKENVFPILVFIAVIFASIIQGQYETDSHHFGLMLSNAKDLGNGRLPYKDIFIQYGILTTLIHALAYSIFKSLLSIIAITSIFYAAGLLLIKEIFCEISKNKKLSNQLLLACFLFHPLVVLPWSNYIAFPFLMLGLLFLIRQYSRLGLYGYLLSGVFFGLAILSREGVSIGVLACLLGFALLDMLYLKVGIKIVALRYSLTAIGIAICLLPFFIYLHINNLYLYWEILSIELPRVYSEVIFTHVRAHKFFMQLLKTIIRGELIFDIRWILIDLIISTNIFFVLLFILKQKSQYLSSNSVKISFASLVFLISMLHIPEIFRFATGGIVGLAVVYHFFSIYSKGHLVSYFVIGSLALTLLMGSSGIQAPLIANTTRQNLKPVGIESFYGQFWPSEMEDSYRNLNVDLQKLKGAPCPLHYQFNATMNNFIPVISPFKPYQVAPFNFSDEFHSSDKFDNLRPDLDYRAKIKDARDIIVFDFTDKNPSALQQYLGFKIFNRYKIDNREIGIYIPDSCNFKYEK